VWRRVSSQRRALRMRTWRDRQRWRCCGSWWW
jgi:hypothetical protein